MTVNRLLVQVCAIACLVLLAGCGLTDLDALPAWEEGQPEECSLSSDEEIPAPRAALRPEDGGRRARKPEKRLVRAVLDGGEAGRMEDVLEQDPDLDLQAYHGLAPIHLAVRAKNLSALKQLLRRGADPNLPCLRPEGSEDFVFLEEEILINAKRSPHFASASHEGRTPLHWAVVVRWKRGVRFLLSLRVGVDVPDACNKTPLHFAAALGYEELVACLLDGGANPNARDAAGCTPLLYALDAKSGGAPSRLIEAGADVTAANRDGTALTRAVKTGKVRALRQLLACGADANQADESGEGPLHLAVKRGRLPVVRILLARGADPHLANRRGQKPVLLARDRRGMAEVFLAYGIEAGR